MILFCLPPHITQDSQPLDCTVFGPLKRQWSNACHEFQQHNPGMVVTKFTFSRVFAQAWLKALTPENIVAGFKKCGIHPLTGMPFQFQKMMSLRANHPPQELCVMVRVQAHQIPLHLPLHLSRLICMRRDMKRGTTSMMISSTWHGFTSTIQKQHFTFSHITSLVLLPTNPANPPSASSTLQFMITSPQLGTTVPPTCSCLCPAVSASNSLPGIIASPPTTSPSSPPAEAAIISSPSSTVGLL